MGLNASLGRERNGEFQAQSVRNSLSLQGEISEYTLTPYGA